MAEKAIVPLVDALQHETPRALQNRLKHQGVGLGIFAQVRKNIGRQPRNVYTPSICTCRHIGDGRGVVEDFRPIIAHAAQICARSFLRVRQGGDGRGFIEDFRPVVANRLLIFGRQLVGAFFRLRLDGNFREVAEKFFRVETVGNQLSDGNQYGELLHIRPVHRETNQRVVSYVNVAAHIRFKNLHKIGVEFVFVGLRQVAEHRFGLDERRRANDFNRARDEVAVVGAEIFVFGDKLVDGDVKFNRADGAAHFVERLNEEMRRYEILILEEFHLLRGQFLNRFKPARIVAYVVEILPPVDALQNFGFVGRELRNYVHVSSPFRLVALKAGEQQSRHAVNYRKHYRRAQSFPLDLYRRRIIIIQIGMTITAGRISSIIAIIISMPAKNAKHK